MDWKINEETTYSPIVSSENFAMTLPFILERKNIQILHILFDLTTPMALKRTDSIVEELFLDILISGGSKGGGGGATGACHLKLDQLYFLIQFCFRMLKNKAHMARKSIKTILELPGPLSGPYRHDRPLPIVSSVPRS